MHAYWWKLISPLIYKVHDVGVLIEQQVFYEWVPLFCQKCHRVGHICKEKQGNVVQTAIHKKWLPKEKEKNTIVNSKTDQETWSKLNQHATGSI